jgi:hypothetical protein
MISANLEPATSITSSAKSSKSAHRNSIQLASNSHLRIYEFGFKGDQLRPAPSSMATWSLLDRIVLETAARGTPVNSGNGSQQLAFTADVIGFATSLAAETRVSWVYRHYNQNNR